MGHLVMKEEYRKLRRRLDGNPVGAPDSEALYDILSLLFTPEEASIASRMPYGFSSTRRLAKLLKMEVVQLEPRLDEMANKGLLFDLRKGDKSLWFLNPLVIGFFEFSMMRIRPTMDQKVVAHKIWEYMFEDPRLAFVNELAGGKTQLFRPLAHEPTLDENVVEILDYDRASYMIESATAWTVGLCHCRHVAHHRGRDCKVANGMENCLSFNEPAGYFARRGMGRAISKEESLAIMEDCRARGMAQIGDNIKSHGNFICNCCNCCCEILESCRRLRTTVPLLSSNFIASMRMDTCKQCGICAKWCPVEAFQVLRDGKKKKITLNDSVCLGCGVCATKCPNGSVKMVARPARVFTPENTLERVVLMALERGKLQNLLFDDPENITHDVLRMFTKVLLKLGPGRQAMAQGQVKSAFMSSFLKMARNRPGADI